MRFAGTLKSWNDDKGFGFISPSQGGQDIFVHISEYRRGGRPVLNEVLTFEVALNPQGKKRAVNVQGANAQPSAHQPGRRRPVRVSRSGSSFRRSLKAMMALALVGALGGRATRTFCSRQECAVTLPRLLNHQTRPHRGLDRKRRLRRSIPATVGSTARR